MIESWLHKPARWWDQICRNQYYHPYDKKRGEFEQKAINAIRDRDYAKQRKIWDRIDNRASIQDTLKDHGLRFTFLAFLDRLTVVRQSNKFLSSQNPLTRDTLITSFNQLKDQGALRGLFRGNLLGVFHLLTVQLQAISISNSNFEAYVPTVLLLDALYYPLDTLRTRYQAEVQPSSTSAIKSFERTSLTQLYSGIQYRLGFTFGFAFYLRYFGGNSDFTRLDNIAILAALYPLLTLKTISQVTLNERSLVKNLTSSFAIAPRLLSQEGLRLLYRGFLPFLGVSLAAPVYFPQLWSEERRNEALEAVDPHWERYKSAA